LGRRKIWKLKPFFFVSTMIFPSFLSIPFPLAQCGGEFRDEQFLYEMLDSISRARLINSRGAIIKGEVIVIGGNGFKGIYQLNPRR